MEELREKTAERDWLSVLRSITNGRKGYEMVYANPVSRCVTDIVQYILQVFKFMNRGKLSKAC